MKKGKVYSTSDDLFDECEKRVVISRECDCSSRGGKIVNQIGRVLLVEPFHRHRHLYVNGLHHRSRRIMSRAFELVLG